MRWVGVAFLSAALVLGMFAQPAAAAADHLFFSLSPVASITSGTLFSVQVQARDSGSGNAVDANFTGNITITAAAVGGSNFTAGNVAAAVAGVANFNVFLNNAANNYQLTASAPGLTGGLSSTFNITADHLSFPTAIANVQAGTAFGTTVEGRDANNNLAENFTGTVNLNAGAPGGANFNGGQKSAAAVAGTATFTNLVLNTAANNYTLTATSASLTGSVSNNFNVTVTAPGGGADHLFFSVNPVASITSGTLFNVQVQARDSGSGNAVDPAFSGNVTITAAAVGGSNFTAGNVAAAVAGVANFNVFLNNAANNYQLTASSTGLTGGLSSTFNITADHLAVPAIANVRTGTAFGTTVEGRDANNNLAENFTGTVNLNAGAPGGANFDGGQRTASAAAGTATFVGLVLSTAANNYTLTAASTGLTGAVSNTFNVTATGPADHLFFSVNPVASITSGTLFNVQVQARDSGSGNAVDANFTGNITITAAAVGGSNFTAGNVAAAVAGVANFTVFLNNAANNYQLTASAAGLTGGLSSTFNITADHLSFPAAIANVQAGTAFGTTVEARDANNNLAENFSGTVNLNAGAPGGANFNGGQKTASAVAGTATFVGLVLNNAANSYTLAAASTGLAGAVSNFFNVTADHLTFVTLPASTRSGTPFTIVVEARDANNALAENFFGVVSLNAAAVGGSNFLGGEANVAALAGTAMFNTLVLNNAADAYIASASSLGLTGASSAAFNVFAHHLTVATVVANVQAGTAFEVRVEARDANNALAENFNSPISLNAAAIGGSNFNGGTQTATAGTGMALFAGLVLSNAADGYSLTASSPGLANGSSNAFNVTADHLVFVTVPSSARAGDPFTIVVEARDANNAVAENFNGNVFLNAAAVGGSNFAGGTANVAAVGGSATFAGLVIDNAADAYAVTASATGLTSAMSAAISVSARQLVITTVIANHQAGTAFGVSVEARDANNAIAENFNGLVSLSAAAIGGSNFVGGTQIETATAGTATFTNLVLNDPADNYEITASSAGLINGLSNTFNVTPASAIFINDVSVTEGDSGTTNATFTVSLSVPSTQTVTVNFATAGVTATSGIDFVSAAGPLTFAPGVTTQTFTVTVNGDLLNEAEEIFSVDLTGATGGTIGDGQGIGTILNDDPLPVISVADVSVVEGTPVRRSAVLEVRLSAPSGQTVIVTFATVDGSAVDGNGEPSPDYVASAGTIVFAPGETLQTIDVSLENDTRSEPDEVFFVDLSGAVNATIGTPRATVTIFDDDSPATQLADLRALVRALDLKGGRETSLLAKLRLDCGPLHAFANEVIAHTGKVITPAQASELLAALDRLLADLQCAPRSGSG